MTADSCWLPLLLLHGHAAGSEVTGRLLRQERGQKWSAELEVQLCYEIKTFLLAGHETSAAMLTWTLYQLTQQPDCLAKARCLGVEVVCCRSRRPAYSQCYQPCSLGFDPHLRAEHS